MNRLTFLLALLGSMTTLASAQNVLPADPLTIPDGIGVNIHFTEPQPGELKMMADAGVKWVRMDFGWGGTEREKGVYDFAAYDGLLKALDQFTIRPVFILDYSNRLYDDDLSPHSPEGVAAFAKWAAAAVTHFKGHAIVWEMYNEPNIGFWRPKPDVQAYSTLALATGKTIRAADPAAVYVGPACSTMDFTFLESCFKAGCLEYWSAVSVHPYRQSLPESVGDDYAHLREMIDRYAPAGKRIPILSGEWGFSSAWAGSNEEQQGKYLSRELLTNLANSIPLSIWYDWHDDGTDPKESEHHFGTVHNAYHAGQDPPYEPKPAYRALTALTHALHGLHLIHRVATENDQDYLLLIGDKEHLMLAAWTTDPSPHAAAVATVGDSFERVSHLGEALPPLHAQGGELKVDLTDAPQFFTCPKPEDAKLLTAPQWRPPPADIGITADGDICHITFAGPWKAPFKGRVEIVAPEPAPREAIMPQRIEADAKTRLLRVDVKLPAGADVMRHVTVRLVSDDGSVFYRMPRVHFAAMPKLRVAGDTGTWPIKVEPDGDPKVTSEQGLALSTLIDPRHPEAKMQTPTGDATITLTYDFKPGWKFVQIVPTTDAGRKLEGNPIALGMWVKGDGSGNALRMRFTDSTGQTFQPSGANNTLSGTDWSFVRFALSSTTGHWGGANDGVVHGPIRIDSLLLLDSVHRQATSGQIEFTSPTLFYAK